MSRYIRVPSTGHGLFFAVLIVTVSVLSGGIAVGADTTQDFTAEFFAPPPPPPGTPFVTGGVAAQVPGGLPGVPAPSVNFMRMTIDNVAANGEVVFNQIPTNVGPYESLFFDFDTNINDPATGADGYGLVYLDTSLHGASGSGPEFREDANVSGSLGFGFDTWNNGAGDGLAGTGSLPDTFSLHFNGTALANVEMATLGVPPDWLENGVSKHVTIAITPAVVGMDVSMSVEEYGGGAIVTPFAGFNIPTMTPYNGRWSFKGRTGGENQNQDIDNLVTTFDPAGADPAIVTNVQDFDFVPVPPTPPILVGGTPFTAAQHGSAPGPTVTQDSPGVGVLPGRMQVTQEIGDQSNSIAFNKTSDIKKQVIADFDVRITDTGAAGSADGLAYMLLDTAVHGDTGPLDSNLGDPGNPYVAFEEPNLAGVLGVALDTFSVGPGNPDSCIDCVGNTGNAVSIHFNGAVLGEVTIPQAELDLVSNVYHHMTVLSEEVPGGINVSVAIVDGVDGSVHTPFTDFFIAGGFAGGVRPAFGARTGGAADFYDIDNVNVAFIPEPSSVALAIVTALAGLTVAYRRRRAAA